MTKFVSAHEAVRLVRSGDTILICGNGSIMVPEKVLAALEERFLTSGEPRDLTAIHPVAVGYEAGSGQDRLAHKGLLKRVIGSGFGVWHLKRMNEMILADEIEAYCLPMGVMFQLLRCTAAGQPGVITPVGLRTFIDPRVQGPGWNNISRDDSLVQVVEYGGQEALFYKGHKIDVAVIRGTTADEDGNITMEDEPQTLGVLAMAMAARNSGGKVIVQVKRKALRGSLPPKAVQIPGVLIDAIVVDPDQRQSCEAFNPSLTGQVRAPLEEVPTLPPGIDKIILNRASMELEPGKLTNLGFGLPAFLPWVAAEKGILDGLLFTTEHGSIGGIPAGWTLFGSAMNAQMLCDSSVLFDLYAGGGLDTTFLGLAQADRNGHVNVSRFGARRPGCGGFIDLTHGVKKIVFCGTFTAKGLAADVADGRLAIRREGDIRKFVSDVEQITLNGREAVRKGQKVLYVTERCVFRLTEEGPVLVEVAPGIDIETMIRPHVEFELKIASDLKQMHSRCFEFD